MREPWWDAVVADVASVVQADGDREVLDEAAEIFVAEVGRCDLASRLARSHRLTLQAADGAAIVGEVVVVGPEVVVVDTDDGAEHAIRMSAVVWADGLAPALGDVPRPVVPAITWASCLRRAAGEMVDVWLLDGRVIRGHVVGIGMDHLDLAIGTTRIRSVHAPAVSRLRRFRTDASRRTRASASTSG